MQELLVPPDERWWPGVADLLRGFAEPGRRDLRRVTVIVPRMAHAAMLRAALVEAWPGAAFVGPRTTTLEDFAGIARLARWRQRAELFDALRGNDWVRETFGSQAGVLWALARDVAALSDELTLAASGAVDAFEGRWAAAVQRHFSRRAARLGAMQAQFVLALWRAGLMAGGGTPSGGAALLRERLERRAIGLGGPFVWLVPQGAAPWQRAVCEAMTKQSGQPTVLVATDRPALVQRYGWIGAAWPEVLTAADDAAADFVPLAERAAALRAATGDAAALPGFSIIKTSTLEEEATAAARWTLDRLRQGARRIALVACDRLTARRVRALLERAQVLVRDESGWKLSTTSACAVVIHWLDLAGADATPQDRSDWLQSPFAAGARDRLDVWVARARGAKDAPGADHLRGLLAALDELGVAAALAADPVGAVVLDALQHLQEEWRDFDLRLRPAEFRAFLAAYFEDIGAGEDTESPVLMTSLAGTRLRRFDAALLIGADADHLPGTPPPGVLMAPAVRRDLGLPGMDAMRGEQTLDWACLLATTPAVAATWRFRRGDEPAALSPLLDRLDRLMGFFPDTPPRMQGFALEWEAVAARPSLPRAPRAPLPARISAGAAQDLVDCPYRFFALRALGLAERERPRPVPDKRDLGLLMHQVLYEFHRARDADPASIRGPAADLAALRAVVDAQFSPRLAEQPALIAYRERIRSWIPGYVAWLHKDERDGWRWRSGESSRRRAFGFGEGDADSGSVELLGRIDRIDAGRDSAVRVIDYKTRSPSASRKAQKELGEDVQLAFYGLLLDVQGSAQAAYLHLERPDDPGMPERGVVHRIDVAPAAYAEQVAALRARLRTDLARIAAGAPLPANGAESVCRRCELRSLCRHGFSSHARTFPSPAVAERGQGEGAPQ